MIFDFQQVYNSDFIDEKDNSLTITESGVQAKITKTCFKYDKFYNISHKLLTKTDSIYSDKKLIRGHGYKKNCDGAFFIKQEEKWILCLCELKTSFKFNNFLLSKLQLEVSYLKLISLFSVLKNFNPDDFESVFFIVSEKPDLEELENKIEFLRGRNTKEYTPASKKYHELIQNNKISITNDCCIISNEPIKDEYTIINSTIHFIEGNGAEIQLINYLK